MRDGGDWQMAVWDFYMLRVVNALYECGFYFSLVYALDYYNLAYYYFCSDLISLIVLEIF